MVLQRKHFADEFVVAAQDVGQLGALIIRKIFGVAFKALTELLHMVIEQILPSFADGYDQTAAVVRVRLLADIAGISLYIPLGSVL